MRGWSDGSWSHGSLCGCVDVMPVVHGMESVAASLTTLEVDGEHLTIGNDCGAIGRSMDGDVEGEVGHVPEASSSSKPDSLECGDSLPSATSADWNWEAGEQEAVGPTPKIATREPVTPCPDGTLKSAGFRQLSPVLLPRLATSLTALRKIGWDILPVQLIMMAQVCRNVI